ncbi:MAG: threonine-phosphate decarboxylase [Firmicutes bacterium]|nr:threonine-phosphate decarboxylase [Bacillota bacterium]
MHRNREAGGHGGDLEAAAREFGLRPDQFCDFSSNVNPLGPPSGLKEELIASIDEISRYPTPQARDFRAALASHLKLPESMVLLGNGANELIHLLFLWKRPQRVLIPSPGFSEYTRAARLVNAKIKEFPLPLDGSLDKDGLLAKLSGSDFFVFCSPNNPTGFFYHGEDLREIIQKAGEKGTTVLLDESFFALTGKPLAQSYANIGCDNLWVVNSLTKLWALPGLRLGYLCGPQEGIKALTENGDPWRVNALAQRAGQYCLTAVNYLEKTIALVKREREFLIEQLRSIEGITVFRGAANFLLLRGEKDRFSATDLFRELASRGILIRDASNYAGLDQRYFRVAVLGREKNKRFVEELRRYFARQT